ncbi:MAG: hypothetical protein JST00_00265 [Deltaproteobacteria bacterium]|nr:hypothetical protein [Deltaproteobacteria bacterium]
MEHEATYEMFWDCKYCGQKKLLGLTHRFCAGCGAPQDPNARYFPPDDEKVLVKDHPFSGADVACPACKQPMSRAAKCCTNCGSPIDKGAEVARKGDVVVPDPGVMPFGPAGVAGGVPAPAPAKGFPTLLVVLGGVVAVIVAIVLVVIFWKREGVFEVTGHTWERNIAVERFEPVRKSVWCDGKPIGARELSRRKEQRSTKQVQDGETCQTRKKDNGNGTFKEVRECKPKYKSEPVYDDKCEIEVTEWHTSRTLTAKGTSPSDPPKWPLVTLSQPGSCLGCEREGSRSEKYTVTFADPKAKTDGSCDLPESRWATFPKGSKWKGKIRVLTGGVDCDTLSKQ